MSGFSLQVQKDVASDTDVTVAYSKFADGLKKNMFSDANLQRQRVVPDIDMADASLSDMSEAFLISKNNWIRFKLPKNGPKEIYISQNNGLNWDRKAFVKLDPRGGFSVSVSGTTTLEPVIYAPFRAPGFHTETGGEIIGLIKFTRIFNREIPTYDETNLIYLPEKGSLGMIATGLHSHAVFGVNPKDALHIIAPDI